MGRLPDYRSRARDVSDGVRNGLPDPGRSPTSIAHRAQFPDSRRGRVGHPGPDSVDRDARRRFFSPARRPLPAGPACRGLFRGGLDVAALRGAAGGAGGIPDLRHVLVAGAKSDGRKIKTRRKPSSVNSAKVGSAASPASRVPSSQTYWPARGIITSDIAERSS